MIANIYIYIYIGFQPDNSSIKAEDGISLMCLKLLHNDDLNRVYAMKIMKESTKH